MGFFASIEFLWYVVVIAGILLSVRAALGIIGWLTAFVAIGRAKRTVVDGQKKGSFHWTLD